MRNTKGNGSGILQGKMVVALFTLLVLFTFHACDRIKNKGRQIKDNVNGAMKRQADKVFPPYDSGRPDTHNNQKWFRDFLHTDLSADVSGILVWSDNVGIDNTVLITFKCADSTARKIIDRNDLKLCAPDDHMFITEHGISWWDNKSISRITPYKAGVEGKYWMYFCYDTSSGNAYYENFDL